MPKAKIAAKSGIIPIERIAASIYLVRGQQVILDADLAALYGVETKVLNQAVRRNIDHFPEDFMSSGITSIRPLEVTKYPAIFRLDDTSTSAECSGPHTAPIAALADPAAKR